MDRSRREGIGQWHEYDHVACNNGLYTGLYTSLYHIRYILKNINCLAAIGVEWRFVHKVGIILNIRTFIPCKSFNNIKLLTCNQLFTIITQCCYKAFAI